MKFGLALKLNLLIAFVAIFFTGILGWFFFHHEIRAVRSELEERGNALCSNLGYNSEYGVLTVNRKVLLDLLNGVLLEKDVVWGRIEDEKGAVLIETGEKKPEPIKEFVGSIITKRSLPRKGEDLILGAEEEVAEQRIGAARIGLSLAGLEEKTRQLRTFIGLVTLPVVLSIIAFIFLSARSLVFRPIRELTLGTQRIAEGDLLHRVKVPARDEFGILAGSFNEMTEKLRETRDFMENLLNYSPAPIIVWDPSFKITRVNRAFEHLTGMEAPKLIGASFDILFPDDRREEAVSHMRHTAEGERWEAVEIAMLRADGTVRIVLWNSANIYADDGTTLLATIGEGTDITERKRADDQIRASLKEKEVLLKEIHHRVKNNLQVISSLLNLQLAEVKGKQAVEMFREGRDRVKSMALVHEELYRSKRLSKINFKGYLQTLTGNLFRSYGVDLNTLALEIGIDDALLGIDTAIPCGLIVNELVSNSLKHAFPKGRKGEIRVGLHSNGNNRFVLTVSDNGVGFPADIDFRNTQSLGLQLVCTLVDQIDGAIELHREHGTEFRIAFAEVSQTKS